MKVIEKILATKIGQELFVIVALAAVMNLICLIEDVNSLLVNTVFFTSIAGIAFVHLYDWWMKSEIREVLETMKLSKWVKYCFWFVTVGVLLTVLKIIFLWGPQ